MVVAIDGSSESGKSSITGKIINLRRGSGREGAQKVVQNIENKSSSTDFCSVLEDLMCRDFKDTNREITPLRQAPNAIYIDSSDMTSGEVVSTICSIVKNNTEISLVVNSKYQ